MPFSFVKVRTTPSTVTVMSVETTAATFWATVVLSGVPATPPLVRVPLREAVMLL